MAKGLKALVVSGPKVNVKNDAEKPVPVEVLAESIVAISQGVKKLLAGPIKEETLLLLIQDAAPRVKGPLGRSDGVTKKEIKAVLDGIVSLEATHLKRKPTL